ncbi:bacteriocin immunity protein [Clostridium sp. HMSC19A10]|uniref:bacteriocin immunity protein n=1 Tax=Clostridium sp. HMSC19A10 TaxID=1581148 RepID=UPI0008A14AEC|nr:bacteriocin immunity protein [Clostridium sp. HMSC19A10]OFS24187.1 hypothetical protein HMPREF3070_05915 [Clostridium sp. HMSC19A10]
MNNKLSREELIDLVNIIMNSGVDSKTGKEYTDSEVIRMVQIFESNITSPDGSDLIFYPDLCGLKIDASAEEIVDAGLNYKAGENN